MKKLLPLGTVAGFLSTVSSALADVSPPPTIILSPAGGINPRTNEAGDVINRAIQIIFVIAILLVLVMLVWGAIQWILSSGDKEKVANARNRIIAALVGLAILALAFLIAKFVGQILNIDVLNFTIPQLGKP